jgi:predicted PurR-regulated permease PerM
MASNQPARSRRVTALQVLGTLALLGLLLFGCVLFLVRIKDLVFILIASIFLAYILNPVVRWLQRRMHIVFAILVVYVAIAILIALVVMFMVPPLISDAATFVKGIPKLVTDISAAIADPHNRLFAWLPAPVRDYLANLPQQLVGLIQQYGFSALHQAASFLLSAVAILAAFIVVPILTAYILLDQENLVRVFLGLFPDRSRPKAKAVLLDLDRVLGGFIRGQILDAIAVGVLIFILLTIFHVPYAYLVAVFSGVFQVIPYLGAIVAFFPAVALAWINNGSGDAIGVAIGVIVVHQLDGNIIAPRILRDNVGLSPFWIIVSVLGFTELFGFVGTFVAVPAAAMIRVIKMHFLPAAVDREEAKPTRRDHELRLDDEEIANVEHR